MLNDSYKKVIVDANGDKYESYKTVRYVHETPVSENSSNLQINNNKAIMTINSLELTGGATATTEDIVVTRSGKNLFDKNSATFSVGYYNNDGIYQASATGTTMYLNEFISVIPSTSYFSGFLGGYKNATLAIYFYDKNKNWISRTTKFYNETNNKPFGAFVTPNNCCFIRLQVLYAKGEIYSFNPENYQLEIGTQATEYEPYISPKSLTFSRDYLLSLKGVNNLLDKSKFPATQTRNGITFTNNGDGTITANGTATATTVLSPIGISNPISIVSGHKFLFISCPPGGSFSTYYSDLKKVPEDESSFDFGVGVVMTTTSTTTGLRFNIRVISGYTANNLVFKPELFDLTAIYGEGNEPTTVEQFLKTYPLSSTDKITITKDSVKYNNVDITEQVTGLSDFMATNTETAIIDTNYVMGSISADVKKLFVSYKKSIYQANEQGG